MVEYLQFKKREHCDWTNLYLYRTNLSLHWTNLSRYWTNLFLCWANLSPYWTNLSRYWTNLFLCWDNIYLYWTYFSPYWANLSLCWTNLFLYWANLSSFWTNLSFNGNHLSLYWTRISLSWTNFFIIIKVIIPLLTWIFISGNFGSGLGNIPLIPGGDFASRGIPVGGNQGSSPYIHTITQSQSHYRAHLRRRILSQKWDHRWV